MPLQIAKPDDQLGDGGSARILLNAQELVRIDGLAVEPCKAFLSAERHDRLQHLTLKALHEFEGDIEEVARAARRIEHAGLAKLIVEGADDRARFIEFLLAVQPLGRGLRHMPVLHQRLDDGGHYQPFDERTRRIVSTKPSALLLVQRLLQQRTENRRLDLPPVCFRCD